MNEKELIRKIKDLRGIRPREDWVILTKSQILGEEPAKKLDVFPFSGFQLKPAFITLLTIVILIGIFGFAQNTVPGDLLYPVKKMAETTQVSFAPDEEKSKIQLELANKRLEELNQIAQKNRVKNLAPVIKEFQVNISEAAKNLAKVKDVKEIVAETKKIEENKQKVEALGIVIGETEELNNALAQLVEREINFFESRSLTETQQELFEEAKELYRLGQYSEALEKILLLTSK